MKEFKKLNQIQRFNVVSVSKPFWKMFDTQTGKFLTLDQPCKGYSKKYRIESDLFQFEVSASNLGDMLEQCFSTGKKLLGATFNLKNNGKTGIEIRYFFNIQTDYEKVQYAEDEIQVDDNPFN